MPLDKKQVDAISKELAKRLGVEVKDPVFYKEITTKDLNVLYEEITDLSKLSLGDIINVEFEIIIGGQNYKFTIGTKVSKQGNLQINQKEMTDLDIPSDDIEADQKLGKKFKDKLSDYLEHGEIGIRIINLAIQLCRLFGDKIDKITEFIDKL